MRSVCIHRIGTVLLILMSVMVLSCQKGLSVFVDSENPASLTLSLSADKHLMVTKGIEDLDDNGAVTELEEIIDGKKMYRLAVFLMDGTTTVQSTVLDINDIVVIITLASDKIFFQSSTLFILSLITATLGVSQS